MMHDSSVLLLFNVLFLIVVVLSTDFAKRSADPVRPFIAIIVGSSLTVLYLTWILSLNLTSCLYLLRCFSDSQSQ